MSAPIRRGIQRKGLDAQFTTQEGRKSKLILEGKLLHERADEAASDRFAQAAEIEEHLAHVCDRDGLTEKSSVHHFSAASCWAQAGNFYRALALCDELLGRPDLPPRLHQRISSYAHALRIGRSEWYATVAADSANED